MVTIDPFQQRRVLLIGGTGFVGTNLDAELTCAGHQVLVTGRSARTGAHRSSAHAPVSIALSETDAIVQLVRDQACDTVVHLASGMKPSSLLNDFILEQERIAAPTMRLAFKLAELGVRLVFLSSGGTVYGVTEEVAAAEDHRCAPISLYGHAKRAIEQDLAFVHRTAGLSYLVLRPSNPFGPHQALHGAQGLISVALGKMAAGEPLTVWGDGSNVRDYIYIDDMVAVIRRLIEEDIRDMTLNIGSGVGHTLVAVIETLSRVAGRTPELVFNSGRPVDVPRLVLNVERLRALGLYQARPLEDGIRDYLEALGLPPNL